MELLKKEFIFGILLEIKFLSHQNYKIFIRHIVVPYDYSNERIMTILLKCLNQVTILSINKVESIFYSPINEEEIYSNNLIDTFWKDGIIFFIDFKSHTEERCYSVALTFENTDDEIAYFIKKNALTNEQVQVSEWSDCWILR